MESVRTMFTQVYVMCRNGWKGKYYEALSGDAIIVKSCSRSRAFHYICSRTESCVCGHVGIYRTNSKYAICLLIMTY